MRILIAGLGKSGTSALFYATQQGAEAHFGRPFAQLFEPKDNATLDTLPPRFAVAKVLSERLMRFSDPAAAIARFDARVMIVRDPRDNVVSRLLWLIATRIGAADPAVAAPVMAALRRKQADPASISLHSLCDLAAPVTGHDAGAAAGMLEFGFKPLAVLAQHPGFHLLRYEDFVDWNVAAAEAYLGFCLRRDFEMPHRHRHILRAGRHGDWMNWYTEDDLARLSARDSERLQQLGYAPGRPAGHAMRIEPDDATGYVERTRVGLAGPQT